MDLERFAILLEATFPDLKFRRPMRLLGSGFRSTVIESGNGFVFRIGKIPETIRGYAIENRLLPQLSKLLPRAIPQPLWYLKSSKFFPYGLIGYKKLDGRPLRLEETVNSEVVSQIAEFLACLHSLDPINFGGLIPRLNISHKTFKDLEQVIFPVLSSQLKQAEWRQFKRYWKILLKDRELLPAKLNLRHGDFWYENLLVNEDGTELLGVLDFENIALGDSAEDFASLRYLGTSVVTDILNAYIRLGGNIDSGFGYQTKRYEELRELHGLAFAIRYNDEELSDAIKKVRQRIIQVH